MGIATARAAMLGFAMAALLPAVTTSPASAQPLGIPATEPQTAVKEGTVGAQLLLPFFTVDTVNPNGPTTFWAIRNETTSDLDLVVSYYTTDGVLQRAVAVDDLGRKAVLTANVRTAVTDYSLAIDPTTDFASGYATIATVGDEAVIHGDYFLLNDGSNFASGSRLVNIDPTSNGNDLCTRFSMRFLDSALVFDSGTLYTIWVTESSTLAYSIYDEAGGDPQLANSIAVVAGVTQISASDLMIAGLDLEFGAIEFQFSGGVIGHISAVLDAFGRYSVGYEATCLDPT